MNSQKDLIKMKSILNFQEKPKKKKTQNEIFEMKPSNKKKKVEVKARNKVRRKKNNRRMNQY